MLFLLLLELDFGLSVLGHEVLFSLQLLGFQVCLNLLDPLLFGSQFSPSFIFSSFEFHLGLLSFICEFILGFPIFGFELFFSLLLLGS
jgi:hypothetical protein